MSQRFLYICLLGKVGLLYMCLSGGERVKYLVMLRCVGSVRIKHI